MWEISPAFKKTEDSISGGWFRHYNLFVLLESNTFDLNSGYINAIVYFLEV